MTDSLLRKAFQSFIDDKADGNGISEATNAYWTAYFTRKGAELVFEDHEEHMAAKEMSAHLRKLFKMCEDSDTKEKFLKKLGKAADVEDCTEKDIKKCSEALRKKDKKDCDEVIHDLEDLVGYDYEPEDDDDKEKLNESWNKSGRGTVVVHKDSGKEGVILSTSGHSKELDVNVAPIINGAPKFRSPKMWRHGEYEKTSRKVEVPDYAPGGDKTKHKDDED